MLIAPVQPWIMIFGGMGLIAGLSGLEQVAYYLLFVPYASLWWTTMIVKWHATFQGGSVEVAAYGGGAMVLDLRRHSGIVLAKVDSGAV